VTLAYLFTFRLARSFHGLEGFSEYALARRTLSLITPVAVLGADYAIARFVAYLSYKDPALAKTYFVAATTVVTCGVVTISTLLWLFPGLFSGLLFGSPRYYALISAIPWTIAGFGLHSVTYNHLRGQMRFRLANLLVLTNYGFMPILSLLLAPSVPLALEGMGIGWGVTSLLVVPQLRVHYSLSVVRVREVLRYGLPRVPGDLLLLALYSLPSIVAAHLLDFNSAGIVALGTAALGAFSGLVSPISFILLPTSARYLANREVTVLRAEVIRIAMLVLAAVVPGVAITQVLLATAIPLYLGSGFNDLVPLRILLVAAVPLSIFTVFRSVVDAHHVRAVNTRNIAICTAAFVVASAGSQIFWSGMVPILVAFDASLGLLAILTATESYRILKVQPTEGQTDAELIDFGEPEAESTETMLRP
jgi:O-antigen/teichoic acid export membrane protein